MIHSLLYKSSLVIFAVFLVFCNENPPQKNHQSKLQVIATTSIIGDVAANIASDKIDLTIIVPNNSDPHSFEPTPRSMATIGKADLIFINGAGLEHGLERIIQTAGDPNRIVSVSRELEKAFFKSDANDSRHHHEGEEEKHLHQHQIDPHFWFDPNNVISWTDVICITLSEKDSAHAVFYKEQAHKYVQQLHQLNNWIVDQVDQIPVNRRMLVTDHQLLGYFAKRFGFQQAGSIIPGFDALSEPSAQDLSRLQDTIVKLGIRTVFAGYQDGANRSSEFSRDMGVKIVNLYTGSLGGQNSGAETYIDFMRRNTTAIVDGLKE